MTEYKIEDVYQNAGEGFSKLLDAYFPDNKDDLVQWFYHHQIKRFDGSTPHELCEQGKGKMLEDILMGMALGMPL